jgi:uncharacterized protein YwqG
MFKIGSVPEQLSSYALAAIGMKEVPGGLRSSTGGLPPEGLKFEWPQFDGQSLSFLAIIYLDELPMLHDWLPRDGVLLFFYDFENGPTGDDLAESPGWKVIWVTDISGCDGVVCERPENLKDGFVFKARPLSFEAGETLPFLMDHPLIQEVERPDELIEELEELEAELEEEEGGPSSGQIGGYSGAADGALYAFRCREQIMGEDPMLAYDATLEDIQAALLFEFEMEEREAEEAPEIFGTRNFSFWAFKADVRNQDFSKVWLQVEVD